MPKVGPVLKPIPVLAMRFNGWRSGEVFPSDRAKVSILFEWLDNGGFESIVTDDRLQKLAVYLEIGAVPSLPDFKAWALARNFDLWMERNIIKPSAEDSAHFIEWLRENPDTKRHFETFSDLIKTVDYLNRKDMGFGYAILHPSEAEFNALAAEPPPPPKRRTAPQQNTEPLSPAASFFTSLAKLENRAANSKNTSSRTSRKDRILTPQKHFMSPSRAYFYPSAPARPLSSYTTEVDMETLASAFHAYAEKNYPYRNDPNLKTEDSAVFKNWLLEEDGIERQLKAYDRLQRLAVFINERMGDLYYFTVPKPEEFHNILQERAKNTSAPQLTKASPTL